MPVTKQNSETQSETQFKPCCQFKFSKKRGCRVYNLQVSTDVSSMHAKNVFQNIARHRQTCRNSISTGVDLEIHIRRTKRYNTWYLLLYLLQRTRVHKKNCIPVSMSMQGSPKAGLCVTAPVNQPKGCLFLDDASFKSSFLITAEIMTICLQKLFIQTNKLAVLRLSDSIVFIISARVTTSISTTVAIVTSFLDSQFTFCSMQRSPRPNKSIHEQISDIEYILPRVRSNDIHPLHDN